MAIRLKVRSDIATAVSVSLLVSQDEKGNIAEQEQIFLPGAELPENVNPRLVEQYQAGDPHATALFEQVGGGGTKSTTKKTDNPFESAG